MSPPWLDFGLPENSPLLPKMMTLMKESVQSVQVVDPSWIYDGSKLQPIIDKFVASIPKHLLNHLDRSGQNVVDGKLPAMIMCDPPYGFFPNMPWDVPAGDHSEGLENLGLECKGTLSTKIQVCIQLIWFGTW
jgi:hypothetical protein